MTKSRFARIFLLFATAANGLHSTVAAACWHPNEIVAGQVKDFQYMLMVGTLRCRASNTAVEASYNAFVTRHRGTLDSSAIVLKAHFLREIGIAAGQQAYDQHTTLLSNRHSGRHDAPSFCATVDLYSRMAALASDNHFVTMARTAVEAPASQCPPAVGVLAAPPPLALQADPQPAVRASVTAADVAAAAAAEAGMAAQPAFAEAPFEAAPAPAAMIQPAVAQEVPSPMPAPAAMAQEAPVPVAAIAAAMPAVPAGAVVIAEAPVVPPQEVATAPARDSVQALQDAIKALQAATEALAAQQTTPI